MVENQFAAEGREEKQFSKMTAMPIPKLLLSLAIPSVLSMVTTSVYNMADTYFVSQLGTSASGAVGVVMPLMAVIQAFGFTFAMGSGSNIAQLLGRKERDEANRYASSALASAMAFGLLIMLAGLLFMKPMLSLSGATETIYPYAKAYAEVILLGAPFICSSFVMNVTLRSQGQNALSMFGLMFGGFLNMFLDPLFIFTFKMGIAGAAWATILSQFLSWLLLIYMVQKKSMIHLSFRSISLKGELYYNIMRLGLPSFFRQSLASLAGIMLNNRAAVFGDQAVAAMSIVGKLTMLIMSVILGIGQAFQPIAGYNYGAGNYLRVKDSYRFTIRSMISMAAVVSVGLFIFAPEIILSFRKDDPGVLAIGSIALRLQCLTLVTLPFLTSCNMLLQSCGQAKESMFLATIRQGIYFIPLIAALPLIFGLNGIIAAQPVADILAALSAVPFQRAFYRKLAVLEAEQKQAKEKAVSELPL